MASYHEHKIGKGDKIGRNSASVGHGQTDGDTSAFVELRLRS